MRAVRAEQRCAMGTACGCFAGLTGEADWHQVIQLTPNPSVREFPVQAQAPDRRRPEQSPAVGAMLTSSHRQAATWDVGLVSCQCRLFKLSWQADATSRGQVCFRCSCLCRLRQQDNQSTHPTTSTPAPDEKGDNACSGQQQLQVQWLLVAAGTLSGYDKDLLEDVRMWKSGSGGGRWTEPSTSRAKESFERV